jgi:sugar lactone lactonase YvrE
MESPFGIAADNLGNLYIETPAGIRKVTPDGLISTLGFRQGTVFAVDPTGNFYFGVFSVTLVQVVKVKPNGVTASTVSIPSQNPPQGIAVDGSGNTYVTLAGAGMVTLDGRFVSGPTSKIVMVTSAGAVKTIAGGDSIGDSGEGGPAVAAVLYAPHTITADAGGTVYFIDGVPRIRRIDRAGTLTTLVTGIGDGGPAAFAMLNYPGSSARDAAGNLYIADQNRIRKIDGKGTISTFAGTGVAGQPISGKPAAQSFLSGPATVLPDALGNVYISDTNGIYRVDARGILTTMTTQPYSGYGTGLAIDKNNSIYVTGLNCIRKVNPDGTTTPITVCLSTVPYGGYSGDGGPAIAAQLGNSPAGMIFDAVGNLYIADTRNHRVRRIGINGVITTVAGNGTAGCSGDGGLAVNAQLNAPQNIAFDAGGNLFIADSGCYLVRKVLANGLTATVAGNGKSSGSATPGPANLTPVTPTGLAPDGANGMYVTDSTRGILLRLTPSVQPAVNLSVSHTDSFAVGAASTFTIVPTNIAAGDTASSPQSFGLRAAAQSEAGSAATSPVTVTMALSTGDGLASLSGDGWSCSGGACTRSEPLPPGASFPPITAMVVPSPDGAYQLTLEASVSGDGIPTTGAQDTADVSGPLLKIIHTDSGNLYAGQINAKYSIMVLNAGATATSGIVTATETLPLGIVVPGFQTRQ